MAVAFRRRANRDCMQQAWLLRHQLAPHLQSGDVTVQALFEAMPGAFPSDIQSEERLVDGLPASLSESQRAESLRRRNRKRLLSPRK